jgi:hypothetical protein
MASNKLTVVNDLSPPDIVFGVLYCLGPTCVCPLESAWVCETVSRTCPSVYDDVFETDFDQHVTEAVVECDVCIQISLGH